MAPLSKVIMSHGCQFKSDWIRDRIDNVRLRKFQPHTSSNYSQDSRNENKLKALRVTTKQ